MCEEGVYYAVREKDVSCVVGEKGIYCTVCEEGVYYAVREKDVYCVVGEKGVLYSM